LDRFVSLSLACLDVPLLIEPNMPSANNAIWSLGELLIKVSGAHAKGMRVGGCVRACVRAGRRARGRARVRAGGVRV